MTEPQTAYDILATGMRTGQSFANGRKLADYFHDTHADYPGARAMVNGSSGKEEVAGFAEAFERALFASRLKKKRRGLALMRPRWMVTSALLGLSTAWAAVALACAAPKALVGRWEVEHVNVDMADQMHWGVHPDEPALLGRALIIEPGSVRFTADEKSHCTQTRWPALTTSWSALFNKGFLRAETGGRSPHPTPEDFSLKVSAKERVKAYLLCSARKSARDAWMLDLWIVQQSADTLLMHYDNQVLLVLKRRPESEPPRASFACDKARSPSERTICSEVELASWDRSVAAALRQTLVGKTPDEAAALIKQHNAWRAELSRCETDKKCLDEALWRRVSDLVGR